MEKLFNWTIGSFFRTIGRLIAYFAIGAFIAYILSNSNIKLPGINNLFLAHVSASEFQGIWPNNVQAKVGASGTYQNRNMSDNDMYNISFSNSSQDNARIYWKFDQIQLDSKAEYLYVAFALRKTLGETTTCAITSSTVDCGDWEYTLQVGYWYNNDENQIGICNATQVVSNMIYYSCPIKSTNINGFRLGYDSNEISMYTLSFSPFMTYTLANLTSGMQQIIDKQNQTINAIDSQTQQQQQQHNETISTITDSNTTTESDTASNFFHSQTDDTPSALTDAVTSPLRIINNAITGVHSSLCFTLNNKQVCIPSGDIIWNRTYGEGIHWFNSGQFNPKEAFISLFNVVVGGFLCYKMLLSMLRIFNNVLDPTISKIEVMKL